MAGSEFILKRYWEHSDEETEDTDTNNLDQNSALIEVDAESQKSKTQKLKDKWLQDSQEYGGTDVNDSDQNSVLKEVDSEFQKNKTQKLNGIKRLQNDQESILDLQDSENANIFCTIGKVQHKKDIKYKQILPDWLINPVYISVNLQEERTPISELNFLDSNSKNNLMEAGINFLFPVQLAVIPWLMQSSEQCLLVRPSDICVSAPTGSGKTLAFVLPIIQSLKNRVVCAVRALIVLPVGELAIQVFKVFKTFIRGTDLKVALLTGQKSFIVEQNTLVKYAGQKMQSLVDIVVATPGRVHDHINRTNGFCLKRLRYLVIDEADRMMEEIQRDWLKPVEDAVFLTCLSSNCICSSLNNKRISCEATSAFKFGFIAQPLQKLLYSATLTQDPEQLHTLSLYKPKLFTASASNSERGYIGTYTVPNNLTTLQVVCEEHEKPMVICHLIKQHQFKSVLCFTHSVERAHRLHLVLEEMGLLHVREISSFNRAIQRKIALEQFISGGVDVLVCSDLVARGIDVEDIDCVISYDVPEFIKTYIHRIGRTARAGKSGTAITLLSKGEIPKFKNILQSAGIEIPETVNIQSEDLEPLSGPFQTALSAANMKWKKEKNNVRSKSSKKAKRKKTA